MDKSSKKKPALTKKSTAPPKKFKPKVRNSGEPSNLNPPSQSPSVPYIPQPVFYPSQPHQDSYVDLLSGRYGARGEFFPPRSTQMQQFSSSNAMYQNTEYRDPRRAIESETEEEENEEEVEEEEQEEEEEIEVMDEDVQVIKKGKFHSRAKGKNWTSEEELNLTKAFIHWSEDGKKGDQQSRDSFWGKVLGHFDGLMGEITGRTRDQVASKWKKLNTKLSNFNALYIQTSNNWASGSADVDILLKTQNLYKQIYEKNGFSHLPCWLEVKDHPKWASVPVVAGEIPEPAKRTKTSESGHYTTSNEVGSTQLPDSNEQLTPTYPKHKGKNKSGESSSTAKSSASERALEMMSEFQSNWMKEREMESKIRDETFRKKQAMYDEVKTTMAAQRKVIENKLAREQKEKKKSDLEYFMRPHNDVDPQFLPLVLQQKREIAEEYGWDCPF